MSLSALSRVDNSTWENAFPVVTELSHKEARELYRFHTSLHNSTSDFMFNLLFKSMKGRLLRSFSIPIIAIKINAV